MPHGDILGFAPPLVTTRRMWMRLSVIVREAVDEVQR